MNDSFNEKYSQFFLSQQSFHKKTYIYIIVENFQSKIFTRFVSTIQSIKTEI